MQISIRRDQAVSIGIFEGSELTRSIEEGSDPTFMALWRK